MFEKNISELKQSLRLILKPQTKQTVTPFIWGKPGIGKSDSVRQLADEFTEQTGEKFYFIDLRLSQLESSDLRGIPVPDMDRGIAKWFPPEFLPFKGVKQYEGTSGFLLLDEMNRARTDVLQAAFQLVLDRKIGLHEILESWFIVAAGNLGLEDKTDVNEFDSALNNRFIHFRVKENLKTWTDWARHNNIHSDVVNFIEGKPTYLYYRANDEENVFVTPRSWEKFSNILNQNPNSDPYEITTLLGTSIINGAAAEFLKYLESKQIVSGQDVTEKYTNKNNKGTQYIKDRIGALTRDQIYSLNIEVVAYLMKAYDKMPDNKKKKALNNVLSYTKDFLDKDMYISFMQSIANESEKNKNSFIDDYLTEHETEADLIVDTISSVSKRK